ncbi:VanZ family protein [Oceanidesulfovibrio marinus]|uniref:VanZ family protein n=1 Tax=Oceanidesulfovibrio marinus TaxID=370038 RepID=A0ABX6NEF5_9BACT|nr:VanZ family protein [Oceanidesulfovibrio marinus]QJT08968.1 VanZ family protein [Oceanidesulfovibrio marinus]
MDVHPSDHHNQRPPEERQPDGPPKGRREWKLFSLIWLAGIGLYTALSLMPIRIPYRDPVLWGVASVDETIHFAAFAMLAVFLAFLFRSRIDLFLAYVLLLLLGVATELSHLLIPNRTFSFRDMAANALGCITGSLPGLAWRFSRRVRGKAPLNSCDRR